MGEKRREQTRREGKHVHGNNNDNLRRRAAMH
jgi:hypothetical protein